MNQLDDPTVNPTADEYEAALGLVELSAEARPKVMNVDENVKNSMEAAITNISNFIEAWIAEKHKHEKYTFSRIYGYILQYLFQLRRIVKIGERQWCEEDQEELKDAWVVIAESQKAFNAVSINIDVTNNALALAQAQK